MKRFLSLFLCLGLLLSFNACKKQNTAAELEKSLTDSLVKSGFISGTIDGTVETEITGMGEQTLNMSGSFETDFKSGFPISKISGTVGMANLVTMPFEINLKEDKAEITIFGQTQTHEIDESKRNKIKTAVAGLSSHQSMLKRDVKEISIDGKKALEIDYDENQLNALLTAANKQEKQTKIDDLKICYILTDQDQIDQITADITLSGKQKAKINVKLKPSAIG